MHREDLANRFTSHNKPQLVDSYSQVRSLAFEFATVIDALFPDSREKSLAITALEEAVMWANKGISIYG